MIVYVISESTKKSVNKVLKNTEYDLLVLSWSELLSFHNRKNKKKDYINDEMFSLRFDTCLNSIKGEPGLKQCIFILSEEDIKDFICDNFNLLEIDEFSL